MEKNNSSSTFLGMQTFYSNAEFFFQMQTFLFGMQTFFHGKWQFLKQRIYNFLISSVGLKFNICQSIISMFE